jgi:hypothetical protein
MVADKFNKPDDCHREAGLAAVAIHVCASDCFVASLLAMTNRFGGIYPCSSVKSAVKESRF